MTTPIVTGGSVTFGETRKLADYEGRTVSVTLQFNAADNGTVAEADVAAVLDLAQRRVAEKQQPAALTPQPSQPTAPAPQPHNDKDKLAEKAKAKTGSDPMMDAQPSPTPTPKASEPASPATPAANPMEAPSDLFQGTKGEITDVDLQGAITEKNDATEGKQRNAIRAKIGAYSTAANKSFTGIPQDKREAFLLELASIA